MKYKAWLPEIWYQAYEVEAESEDEARTKIREGQAEAIDGSLDYSDIFDPGWDSDFDLEEI